MTTQFPDIIPYDYWINSQLSIARFGGAIDISSTTYIVDYIFCEDLPNGMCRPDLVKESVYEQMQKDNPEKVKIYMNKVKEQNAQN